MRLGGYHHAGPCGRTGSEALPTIANVLGQWSGLWFVQAISMLHVYITQQNEWPQTYATGRRDTGRQGFLIGRSRKARIVRELQHLNVCHIKAQDRPF